MERTTILKNIHIPQMRIKMMKVGMLNEKEDMYIPKIIELQRIELTNLGTFQL